MADPSVKPVPVSYKELMANIESGVLKIPAFQRDFDWGLERTIKLLDSIAKRYPVGAFLVWRTNEVLGSLRNIGGLALPDTPPEKEVEYVLDGQQRITSLYAAAKGLEVNGESYRVYVDLDADPGRQEVMCPETTGDGRYVILADVIGEKPQHVYKRLSNKRASRFDEVREAFREYQFPCMVVQNQPIEAVCEMFERVNTGGMELDVFDIMVAKTWTPEFNLRDKWDQVEQELRKRGYERIGPRTLLQAAAAHVRGSVAEREILLMSREDMIPAWEYILKCVWRSIDFLRNNCKMSALRLLSYPSVVVMLSHFFDQNGCSSPTRDQAVWLQKYVWRTGLDERYGSNPTSVLAADMGVMKAIAAGQGETVGVQNFVWPERCKEAELRTSSAFCRAMLGVLALQRPLSIKDGGEVILDNSYLAQANSRHYHHIFPKAWLKQRDALETNPNALANIMFVPAELNLRIGAQPPSRYMGKLAASAGGQWKKWLRSHLIPAQAWDAILDNDYDRFASIRSKTMGARANKLMDLSDEEIREITARWEE